MVEAPVVIYSTRWCPYCTLAKRYLDAKGVAWREVDLTADPVALAALKATTSHRTVPLIFVNDTFVGGFTDLRDLDRRGGLAPLLAR